LRTTVMMQLLSSFLFSLWKAIAFFKSIFEITSPLISMKGSLRITPVIVQIGSRSLNWKVVTIQEFQVQFTHAIQLAKSITRRKTGGWGDASNWNCTGPFRCIQIFLEHFCVPNAEDKKLYKGKGIGIRSASWNDGTLRIIPPRHHSERGTQ
jgi:hypothetical protein